MMERAPLLPSETETEQHGATASVDPTPSLPSTDASRGAAARIAANVGAFVAITVMIISWIASGELVQGLTAHYPHPFAVCFVTRLTWVVFLLGWGVHRLWWFPRVAPTAGQPGSPLGPFGWATYVRLAAVLSMVGLMSGWTWYISLAHTPLPANTAVYQTAPVMVFIISVPVLGEKVTVVKAGATVVCVVGAILVSMGKGNGGGGSSSSNGSTDHITRQGFGFAMCALSTLLYAIFEVAYKRKATDDADPVKLANAFRFIGLIGASVLLAVPLFPVLHYTGVESFALPSPDTFKLMLVNCALDAGFNVSLLVAIMLTSPLFCSVATVLTLPVAILANLLLHKPDDLDTKAYIGCVMIVCGFLSLTAVSGGH